MSQELLAELCSFSPRYLTDIERGLHCPTINKIEEIAKVLKLEAYELLMSDESTANEAVSLSDLAEYSIGAFKADEAWSLFSAANNDLHFQLSQDALKAGEIRFTLRSAEEIDALSKKQYEKEHESEIRAAFIARLKARKLDLPDDAKFMGEVEAFALCTVWFSSERSACTAMRTPL